MLAGVDRMMNGFLGHPANAAPDAFQVVPG